MHPFESYLREICDIRYSGAAVKETSYYGLLAMLLNEADSALKPEEAREVRDIARRIAVILLLEPALDAGYWGVRECR